MIKSQYITNILDILLDGDSDGLNARQQLPFLTESEYNYAGSGLFVSFEHNSPIENYIVEKKNLILNGVKIETDEYPIEADATLFFKDGIINYLEIWCYLGDYPKQDLQKYTLTQIWGNSPGKTITTEN